MDTNILPNDQNFVRAAGFVSSTNSLILLPGQIIEASGRIKVDLAGGSGTVTSVSVVSANGFAGTVATSTTTPAITLSTTITGILKGNGTAISAVTIGSGLAYDGTTLSATGGGITIGTTTITSGTNTRILYNNAGVVGEYTLTGSGTVVAMQTAPTFVTSITSPIINLSATSNQLVLQSAGVTGTLTWTPASTNKVITFPNATGTVALTSDLTAYANTALSNLASVAINTSLISDTNNTDDLGSTGIRWKKTWTVDLESTNMPTVGGTAILSSLTAPSFTTVELGAGGATDTTLSRAGAGDLAVEGVSVLTTSNTKTVTLKRIQPRTASTTSNANLSPDLSSANVYYRTTQTTGLTIDAPTGTPVIGETIMMYIDAASSQTLTINSTYKAFGVAFPAATTAGKTFMMSAQYNGTDWKTLWANAV